VRINFIKPIPPSREKELRIWYRIMLGFLLTVIPAIIIVSTIQLYLWASLHRTKVTLANQLANFNGILAQQKKDRCEQSQLKERAACMQRYSSDPKNPASVLAAITDAAKESQLQSIAISKKSVEIQIHSASTDIVLTTIKRLSDARIDNLPIMHDVSLASLTSSGQSIHATIKAVPVRGLRDGKYDRAAKS
jgi:hypothetical protein